MGKLSANLFGIRLDDTIVSRMKALLENVVLTEVQKMDIPTGRAWVETTAEGWREYYSLMADRLESILENGSAKGTIRAEVSQQTLHGRTWSAGPANPHLDWRTPRPDANLDKFSPDYEGITFEFAENGFIINLGMRNRTGIVGPVTLTSTSGGLTQIVIDDPDNNSEAILSAVEELVLSYRVPEAPPEPASFRVFMGHGGDTQWKTLKLALEATHGFAVEAFESEDRTSTATVDTVVNMIRSANAAVVVMTGADTMLDGTVRARENVIHELGLCQGILGVHSTIIVLENGVTELSNIAGITQVRFPKNDVMSSALAVAGALENRKRNA
ncbi:hypothetical protein GY21_12095 [Cryobacterium roopkundense]|uniref:Putative nucleotide-binding protein n=1 Tax=Cryobacterium roopkundense TaxID=1001240 RepID=A0A099J391_9MICO|nr:TIR domain-containing protein [Cryobacterium roopkundense]KGJ72904.1 hypothetical protein GY21_12095 [Cryobacterium roopkundense]MBB5642057.1 putative nucleotide-binding protein [Cryobacterium roopkundense]